MRNSPSTASSTSEDPHLPSLPSLVRYFDDFGDRYQTILDLEASDIWQLIYDGKRCRLRFDHLNGWHRRFVKIAFADLISRRSPATANSYSSAFAVLPVDLQIEMIEAIVLGTPLEFFDLWLSRFRSKLRADQMRPVRHFARTACRMNIGRWTLSDTSMVRQLPGASIDKYAGVRDGTAFVGVAAQSRVVEFIDRSVIATADRKNSLKEIGEACILALSFQYGLRPGQISRLAWEDIRFLSSGAVHVSVQQLKQRGQLRGRRLVRSIQSSWCGLFLALRDGSVVHSGKIFQMTAAAISQLVPSIALNATSESFGCNDLRHSAAQRLVDGGASRETVSDFLGHTDTNIVDVYYQASPSQAELVNAALGLSDVYRHVEMAARTQTIDPAVLRRQPIDRQVAGAPHGIPISGIGQCSVGQSLCRRNPVLACYTCHRFLPVADRDLHEQVLTDMRNVVLRFDRPMSVDRVSPAMLQMRGTLEAIQRVLDSLAEIDHAE